MTRHDVRKRACPLRSAMTAIALMMALAGVARAAEEPAQPIRLNQLGVEASGPKRAMLADPSTAPLPWTLTRRQGRGRRQRPDQGVRR
jgi:endoglucanase